MRLKVSLVLPVRNQSDHIAQIVRGHAATLQEIGVPHEIVLVPNGSRDGTDAVCAELAVALPVVRVVNLAQDGWGRAVRCGIAASQGDLICYTNSARTRPEDIKLIVDFALRNPGTVVKATRTFRHSWLRWIGSQLYNRLCVGLFKLRCTDINGTPKLFPRTATTPLLNLSRDDDLIDLEFMWLCLHDRLSVVEIPIHADSRHGGVSSTGWKTAWNLYSGAIRFWRDLRRGGA
jgi:dolichol-phosphate mannosyltransferase